MTSLHAGVPATWRLASLRRLFRVAEAPACRLFNDFCTNVRSSAHQDEHGSLIKFIFYRWHMGRRLFLGNGSAFFQGVYQTNEIWRELQLNPLSWISILCVSVKHRPTPNHFMLALNLTSSSLLIQYCPFGYNLSFPFGYTPTLFLMWLSFRVHLPTERQRWGTYYSKWSELYLTPFSSIEF